MSTVPSPLPYFGRAWQVKVTTASGPLTISNAVAESLRIKFTIDTFLKMIYWNATIEIYNMAQSTANQLQGITGLTSILQFNEALRQGDPIIVSAGYQNTGSGTFNPNANIIYSGRILQPIWTRENVVDWKLTLRCSLGLFEDSINAVNFSMAAGSTDYQSLQQVCAQAKFPPPTIDSASQQLLSATPYSRSQTFFDRPFALITQILKQHNGKIYSYPVPGGITIGAFNPNDLSGDPSTQTPAYAYGPPNTPSTVSPSNTTQGLVKQTLIGTPQQYQGGVTFRVLMDSTPKIADVVQIAPGVLINLAPFQPSQNGGSKAVPPIPSRNGQYQVIGLHYVGDTRGRGDDWYTEIDAVNNAFIAAFGNGNSATTKTQ